VQYTALHSSYGSLRHTHTETLQALAALQTQWSEAESTLSGMHERIELVNADRRVLLKLVEERSVPNTPPPHPLLIYILPLPLRLANRRAFSVHASADLF
jgi:hypothetical protein